MIVTPIKETDSNFKECLTPVRFLDSPRLRYTNSNTNILDCKQRLDILIKSLLENYSKWRLTQKHGLSLCNSIEAIKTRIFSMVNSLKNSENCCRDITLYPSELKPYCDKLASVVKVQSDIIINTKENCRQMKALNKLLKNNNEIFYRSWKLSDFVNFVIELLKRYDHEFIVKHFVLENLPHCLQRNELIHCTSAWEYPQYVDDYVMLMFATLSEETSIKLLKQN